MSNPIRGVVLPPIAGRRERLDRSVVTPASMTMTVGELSDTGHYNPSPSEPAMQSRRSSVAIQADLAGLSHRGNVRPINEDHFLTCRFGRFLRTLSTNLPQDQM